MFQQDKLRTQSSVTETGKNVNTYKFIEIIMVSCLFTYISWKLKGNLGEFVTNNVFKINVNFTKN